MFAMKEYPQDVLPLYAQGHSLTRYLIGLHGRAAFLDFLADGMADENWPRAVREHYGHDSLFALQNAWLDWVKQGRPNLPGEQQSDVLLASNNQPIEQPKAPRRDLSPRDPLPSTNYESAYSRAARQHRGSVERRPGGEGSHYFDAPLKKAKRTLWR